MTDPFSPPQRSSHATATSPRRGRPSPALAAPSIGPVTGALTAISSLKQVSYGPAIGAQRHGRWEHKA